MSGHIYVCYKTGKWAVIYMCVINARLLPWHTKMLFFINSGADSETILTGAGRIWGGRIIFLKICSYCVRSDLWLLTSESHPPGPLLQRYPIFSFMCMFCRSLFVLLSFFLFLFLSFDLRILITPFGIFKLFSHCLSAACSRFFNLYVYRFT